MFACINRASVSYVGFDGSYFAVKKFTDKKEPEYFDDNDFFECDNDLEIIDVTEEASQAEEVLAEQTPKKKAAKKAE